MKSKEHSHRHMSSSNGVDYPISIIPYCHTIKNNVGSVKNVACRTRKRRYDFFTCFTIIPSPPLFPAVLHSTNRPRFVEISLLERSIYCTYPVSI